MVSLRLPHNDLFVCNELSDIFQTPLLRRQHQIRCATISILEMMGLSEDMTWI